MRILLTGFGGEPLFLINNLIHNLRLRKLLETLANSRTGLQWANIGDLRNLEIKIMSGNSLILSKREVDFEFLMVKAKL